MAFRIALSGLDAASTDLEVTGHNIANAATNGFKESRAEFADIYASSIQDVSTTAAGRGVRVSRIAQQFQQGTVDFTANNLDLAINGEGFFIVDDAAGNRSFTRAGAYSVDRDGIVVNHANERLQVFAPIDTAGTSFNTGSTIDLTVPTASGTPNATQLVTTSVNLDPTGTAVPAATPFSPTDPSTYDHATSTTVYDSLGISHTMTMYYREAPTGTNDWYVWTTVIDTDGSTLYATPTNNAYTTNPIADATRPAAFVRFDNTGALVTTDGTDSVDANGDIAYNNLAITGADPLAMNFDYSATTQYGGDFEVNNLTQDGYAPGRLSGIDIDDTGVVFARFTNGQSTALGQVALAKFNNPQGLRQLGDTSWSQTYESGDVQTGAPGTSSYGLVQSGGLENSNVDIAEQLVNLIIAQRNFQANAQTIQTADAITQTIINIR
jgi:flagellar hook protein FlgE